MVTPTITSFGEGPYSSVFGPYPDLATLVQTLPALGHAGRLAAIGTTNQYIYYISQNGNWSPIGLPQFTTSLRPPYAKGFMYFDLTTSKIVVGGASAYETVTSA